MIKTIFLEIAEKLKPIKYDIFDNPELLKIITKTIKDRLNKSGVDSEGQIIRTDASRVTPSGRYSAYTVRVKKKKGQTTKHVTLKDSGSFQDSIEAFVTPDGIFTKADFSKEGGANIIDNFLDSFNTDSEFNDAIIGIQKSEKIKLIDIIIEITRNYYAMQLQKV